MGEKCATIFSFMLATLLFIAILAKFVQNKKKNFGKGASKFPPGRRSWPLIGDSFSWYSAVASSHPPRFVEDQVKRPSTISTTIKSFFFKMFAERQVAINLMVNQLFGVSSESEINKMAQLFSDFVDGCLSVPIKMPGFTYYTAMQARETIISKINKTIVEIRRREAATEVGNGVLGRLLEEESLPDDAIADFMINLLFAGNETTAKTILFAVYFLTQCPKALMQLTEEQDSLRSSSDDHMLTWQDYKAMPFTQCVIDETLRVGGIAIWLMREAKEDVEYQDYVIPKGCFVVPFLSAVHLDENLYKGALSFNPWRWMDPENQEKRNWRSSPFYAPFGGGARFCPGAELARLQIALFLHYFVTRYRWTQIKEDQMSFFPSARLVNGFQIRINKRLDELKMQ
ncbi:hypothetical protein HHK36_024052 [Tetracentron sinense]|uniref:Cytochrome P450 n=1 Tax=Tetracentron sinense TaxID=13715 RepID=A0A835D6C1_TETSI|nr:hypothetical protein HHK36_024052 [Tetracentron sinense]